MHRFVSLAQISHGHAHRFRDTFALGFSLVGVPSTMFPFCSGTRACGFRRGITPRGSVPVGCSCKGMRAKRGVREKRSGHVHGARENNGLYLTDSTRTNLVLEGGVESHAQVEARLRDVSSHLERLEPKEFGGTTTHAGALGSGDQYGGHRFYLILRGISQRRQQERYPQLQFDCTTLVHVFRRGGGQSIRQVMQFEC